MSDLGLCLHCNQPWHPPALCWAYQQFGAEKVEKLAANILNSSFTPTASPTGDGVALVAAKHPELLGVPRNEDMTRTTRDIAEHLVDEIMHVIEPGEIGHVIHSIERELDKYFDEGTLMWRRYE